MTEEEKKAAKKAEEKAAKDAKKAEEKAAKAAVVQTADKTYTAEEVQAMLQQVLSKNTSTSPAEPDERKKVRLARIESHLIVDFVNKNNDPFLPNVVVHAFNKWNESLKQFEAWLEVVFDDGTTKEMPLLYLVSNARPIECPIIKQNVVDTSYSLGMVDKKVYDEKSGGMQGQGLKVKQEVKQQKVSFVISTPDGKELEVPEYVVNIV